MYVVTKQFDVAMGHRLSKHAGFCKSLHGHNLCIEVKVSSDKLNENDMVIDFSDLKKLVHIILDHWDHALFQNSLDMKMESEPSYSSRVIEIFEQDPTSEVLCKFLYIDLKSGLKLKFPQLNLCNIKIWENDRSSSEYFED